MKSETKENDIQTATEAVFLSAADCAKKCRISRWIFKGFSYLIGTLAALLTCLYYLGWLEPIRAFIYKVLWPK